MATFYSEIPGTAPAIGPYSKVATSNGFAFLSGQVGLDPTTTKLVEGGIEAETTQTLKNIETLLTHLKLSFPKVVKATIFLTDMRHFQVVNRIYEAALGGHKPVRSTVAVVELPAKALIEIEMIVEL